MVAWALMSVGTVFGLYFGYYNALLQGVGNVRDSNKSILFGRMDFIFSAILALIGGASLIGLGLATLCSSIISRIFVRHHCKKTE
jgi:O-antigen/teichoic acid export membrane protein